jgi:hypothetical protein
MRQGGCFCRFVRYQVGGEISDETLCHCTICRRTSGAPLVAWMTVPLQQFRFTEGQASPFASSDHGTRTFCPRCGTPLTFQSRRSADEIDVTIASLDQPAQVPPRDQTYTAARLPWMETIGDLPCWPGARREG